MHGIAVQGHVRVRNALQRRAVHGSALRCSAGPTTDNPHCPSLFPMGCVSAEASTQRPRREKGGGCQKMSVSFGAF